MIKIENVKVEGFEPSIRGLRNPKNSWDKSDSHPGLCGDEWSLDPGYVVGENDRDLMMRLAKGGSVHAKYRRMIVVWCDITAPTYWWAEFDTYRFGRERNSCSFMHKGTSKTFEIVDFSFDIEEIRKVFMEDIPDGALAAEYSAHLKTTWEMVIAELNELRALYLKTKDDRIFQMIRRLLPSGYNIRATIMMNYEVLANVYHWRKNHRLDEWRELCKWAETLPYSWCFTLKEPGTDEEGKDILLEAANLGESKTIVIQGTPPDEDNRAHFSIMVSSGEDKLPVEFLRHDTDKPYQMTLYLDGCEIGDLYAVTEPEFELPTMKVVKLDFVIRDEISFIDRVRTLQDDYNQGRLRYVIDYVPTRDEFRLMLSSW